MSIRLNSNNVRAEHRTKLLLFYDILFRNKKEAQ